MTRFEWPILYPGAVIRIEFSVLPGNSIGNAIRTAKVIFGRVKHDSMVNNLKATIFVREFSKNKFFSRILFLHFSSPILVNFLKKDCHLIIITVY